MQRIYQTGMALLLIGALAAQADNTGTDPSNRYAWAANAGWVNAGPSNYAVAVHFDGAAGWLSGYAWGANIGWIAMGSVGGGPYANSTSNNIRVVFRLR